MKNLSMLAIACLLLSILALVPGCREDATPVVTAPTADAALLADNAGSYPPGGMWARYYPLRVGDYWNYDRSFKVWDGDGVVLHDEIGSSSREIIGHEVIGGRVYTVEEWTITDSHGEFPTWIRYRQDRDGLFEADVSIGDPPTLVDPDRKGRETRRPIALAAVSATNELLRRERDPYRRAAIAAHLERHRQLVAAAMRGLEQVSAADLQAGEITRLRYPLRPGDSWVIRDDPFFGAEVEGRELLDMPIGKRVGVRIRITPPIVGPEDDVLVWYSQCGQLRMYVYVESEATDPEGNPLGLLFSEELVELVETDVAGRPACDR